MVNALQATSEKIHNEQSKIFLTHLSSISESEAHTYLLCSVFFFPLVCYGFCWLSGLLLISPDSFCL